MQFSCSSLLQLLIFFQLSGKTNFFFLFRFNVNTCHNSICSARSSRGCTSSTCSAFLCNRDFPIIFYCTQKRHRKLLPRRILYSNIKFSTSFFVNSAFGFPMTSSVRPVSTNFPSSITAISSQNQRTTSRSWEINR